MATKMPTSKGSGDARRGGAVRLPRRTEELASVGALAREHARVTAGYAGELLQHNVHFATRLGPALVRAGVHATLAPSKAVAAAVPRVVRTRRPSA